MAVCVAIPKTKKEKRKKEIKIHIVFEESGNKYHFLVRRSNLIMNLTGISCVHTQWHVKETADWLV
jgi:hypothetical protein